MLLFNCTQYIGVYIKKFLLLVSWVLHQKWLVISAHALGNKHDFALISRSGTSGIPSSLDHFVRNCISHRCFCTFMASHSSFYLRYMISDGGFHIMPSTVVGFHVLMKVSRVSVVLAIPIIINMWKHMIIVMILNAVAANASDDLYPMQSQQMPVSLFVRRT